MEPTENKMGVMPEGKLLASMAIPMMISMLLQALYNVVDSYFVARVSQDAFNALSLAFPLQALMIGLGAGTGLGVNAIISRSLGERRQDAADRAANTGVYPVRRRRLHLLCAVLPRADRRRGHRRGGHGVLHDLPRVLVRHLLSVLL